MSTDTAILQELKKLANAIATLRQQTKKEDRWVSAGWIKDITGWDDNKMQQARRQNIVTWRKKGKAGVEYLLGSVPEEFKKRIV